jgi:hypothetical protein
MERSQLEMERRAPWLEGMKRVGVDVDECLAVILSKLPLLASYVGSNYFAWHESLINR